MPFYNTYSGFLYRQLFICPSKPPSTFSLSGQTGLITGSNSGLGYHASLQLLEAGLSHLILAVRNKTKGEEARKQLLASLSQSHSALKPTVEIWELDLANYSSITTFIERLKQSNLRLDFAILNAGIVNFEYKTNASTGHEETIQINWLSTALLTLLLLPILDQQSATRAADKPRPVISIVGSETAAWAQFKEAQTATRNSSSLLSVLDNPSNFDRNDRYYTSKLLYQLFFLELVRNRRSLSQKTSGAVLNIVNPGFCYGSGLHRDLGGAEGAILGGVKRVIGRSVSMGARTLVHGAVIAGGEMDGLYLSDNRPAPFADYAESSIGRTVGEKVWEETVAELGQVVDMTKLLSGI